MRQRIEAIINKGNLSLELQKKIENYKRFEERYLDGEGDVISGIKIMDRYEQEIVALYQKEQK